MKEEKKRTEIVVGKITKNDAAMAPAGKEPADFFLTVLFG